ncbi:hypothetical protein AB0I37_14340 [Micromonospora purpureochromogenes]|uniref:DUF6907 domain-containing protein n=1 Tax=Micromonospora purpureochromogenes TaxID=47872 RepID=UPI0033E2A8E1
MSIIASAPVPAGSRLIDAPTLGITRIRPALCPPWCTDDHTNDPTDINGFLLGQVHERVFAELTGQHPAWVREASTAAVYVESTTEADEVTTPARVVLSIAQGTEGRHPGEQDCEAWTGTPDEVRALAAVLLAAADLLDGNAR